MRECDGQEIIIQAAAVADYRFAEIQKEKMKKQPGSDRLVLEMIQNPDVARAVGERKKPGQILIGFAAETNRVTEHAAEKLDAKHLDLIVANDVTKAGAGFNVDTNIATLISREGQTEMPLQTKRSLAEAILDRAMALYSSAD